MKKVAKSLDEGEIDKEGVWNKSEGRKVIYISENLWQKEEEEEEDADCNKVEAQSTKLNRIGLQLNTTFQGTSNASYESYMTSLSKEDLSIWIGIKKFKRPLAHISPIIREDRKGAGKTSIFFWIRKFSVHQNSTK